MARRPVWPSGAMRFRLIDFQPLPEAIAWSLVDSLYRQRRSMVMGAALGLAIGVVGFMAAGNALYLAGAGATAAVTLWRLSQMRRYRQRPEVRWLPARLRRR